MKKIALAFSMLMIILMSGCGEKTVLNTPTKKVEAFFANYQTLDDNVLAQLDETIDKDDTLTDEQKDEYRELMKKHYKNLKYDVKDEVIDEIDEGFGFVVENSKATLVKLIDFFEE